MRMRSYLRKSPLLTAKFESKYSQRMYKYEVSSNNQIHRFSEQNTYNMGVI